MSRESLIFHVQVFTKEINLRLVCLVNDYPEQTYLTMLEEVVLPILKSGEPGLARGVAIKKARDMLFLTIDPSGPVAPKKK